MKIIHTEEQEVIFFTGNNPYHVFYINPGLLLHGVDFRALEYQFFYFPENWIIEYQREILGSSMIRFNSGERVLTVCTSTVKENEELSELFKEEGFKVRGLERRHDEGDVVLRDKVLINPNTVTGNVKCILGKESFDLYLRKRELRHFLEFLEVLSKKHNYKTIYDSKSKGMQYETIETKYLIVK